MKYKLLYLLIAICIISVFFTVSKVFADGMLLQGSVVAVPKSFYGLWRVKSKIIDTDSPITFKEKGLDMWNISRVGDVIKLSNPFSGASAEVNVDRADENRVVFTKTGKYDNKILKDTVSITIKGDNFTGVDNLELETISDVDGRVMKTEKAQYAVVGEKVAGGE